MFCRNLRLIVVASSIFASFSAHAIGRCIVARLESVETNKVKETLIVASDLDIPAGARETRYISNDETVIVQIKRIATSASNSEVQANVLVNGTMVLRATGRGNGNFIGTATSVSLLDGSGLSLTCIAQPPL